MALTKQEEKLIFHHLICDNFSLNQNNQNTCNFYFLMKICFEDSDKKLTRSGFLYEEAILILHYLFIKLQKISNGSLPIRTNY
jgi:hypothetical protein